MRLVQTVASRLTWIGKTKVTDPNVRRLLEDAELPSVVLLANMTIRADAEAASEASRHVGQEASQVPSVTREELATQAEQLSPVRLVEGYVRRRESLSARTHYNLACYFVALGARTEEELAAKCFDEARRELDLALEDDVLTRWAQDDPSLTALRDRDSAAFKAILARHTAAPHEPATPAPPSEGKAG